MDRHGEIYNRDRLIVPAVGHSTEGMNLLESILCRPFARGR
jgi:hypothetical protein